MTILQRKGERMRRILGLLLLTGPLLAQPVR